MKRLVWISCCTKLWPTDFIGGIVIKNGKTILTENLAQYYQQRPQHEDYQSRISVPIKARKETIGVLDVFTKDHWDFSQEWKSDDKAKGTGHSQSANCFLLNRRRTHPSADVWTDAVAKAIRNQIIL